VWVVRQQPRVTFLLQPLLYLLVCCSALLSWAAYRLVPAMYLGSPPRGHSFPTMTRSTSNWSTVHRTTLASGPPAPGPPGKRRPRPGPRRGKGPPRTPGPWPAAAWRGGNTLASAIDPSGGPPPVAEIGDTKRHSNATFCASFFPPYSSLTFSSRGDVRARKRFVPVADNLSVLAPAAQYSLGRLAYC